MKYLKEVSLVALATTITAVVTTKMVSNKMKKIEQETNLLKEELGKVNNVIGILNEVKDQVSEALDTSKSNVDEIKGEVFASLKESIEMKAELTSKKSLDEITECFNEINESIDSWKKAVTVSLRETLIEEITMAVMGRIAEQVKTDLVDIIREDLIQNKVAISEDIIKKSIMDASEKMVDDVKEGLEEHIEGLMTQYIDNENQEFDKLKEGVRQVLIIELIKNGLTREQASMVIDEGKVLDMINSMSEAG